MEGFFRYQMRMVLIGLSREMEYDLRNEVFRHLTLLAPRYYQRTGTGLPKAWLELMRRAISTTIWRFSTTRMLHEYTERLYLPAAGVPLTETDDATAGRVVTEAG